jgi:hypothetical protein
LYPIKPFTVFKTASRLITEKRISTKKSGLFPVAGLSINELLFNQQMP